MLGRDVLVDIVDSHSVDDARIVLVDLSTELNEIDARHILTVRLNEGVTLLDLLVVDGIQILDQTVVNVIANTNEGSFDGIAVQSDIAVDQMDGVVNLSVYTVEQVHDPIPKIAKSRIPRSTNPFKDLWFSQKETNLSVKSLITYTNGFSTSRRD